MSNASPSARRGATRLAAMLLLAAWLIPPPDFGFARAMTAWSEAGEACTVAGDGGDAWAPEAPGHGVDAPHHCCPTHCSCMSAEAIEMIASCIGLVPTVKLGPAGHSLVVQGPAEPPYRPPIS